MEEEELLLPQPGVLINMDHIFLSLVLSQTSLASPSGTGSAGASAAMLKSERSSSIVLFVKT